jgi:hypothetical protein
MDWESIAIGLFILVILLIGALSKETVNLVVKMISCYLKRKFIETGLTTGDFPVNVLKYHPSVKESDDSDWNIRILHPKKSIQHCEVRINRKWLSWGDKKELGYRMFIPEYGGVNIHIPKDDFTEDVRVEVWDGREILLNIPFEDIPLVRE